ncbi:hypothetical protein SAMN05216390_101308 [Lachnospiraceae bacterium KH1T2]|nr:hypothetical protein SAMN05216390_101308 [Lachnospiraceae bacterium KH1T2]
MIYYIRSEFVKALTRKYTRYYLLGILAVCLLANFAMSAFRSIIYGMNDGTFAYNLIMFAKGFFWVPYYSCIFIADIVFGNSYPDPRIRDKSTIGLSRTNIFIGKFITELLMLVIYAIIALVVFLVITPLFQVHDGTIDASVIIDFAYAVLITMPLFVAGVALGNMFLFSAKTKKQAYLGFAIGVILLPRLIMFLATDHIRLLPCVWITKILITPQFQTLQFYATRDVPKIIISSIIYTVVACIIGCRNFNKREF